jgi:hypothetical protein
VRVGGEINSIRVVKMFRKWQKITYKSTFFKSASLINNQSFKKIKYAIQNMIQRYGSKDIQRVFFERWKNIQIIEKIKKKSSITHFSTIQKQAMLDVGGYNPFEDKYQKQLSLSSNISYLEQKIHKKMTSFMTISKLLLNQYICRGTILQKNIDSLKQLALQQNALQRRMCTH